MAVKIVPAVCPSCGAGLQVDPGADSATCVHCNTTSFIDRPGHRAPPGTANTIRVQQPQKSSPIWTLLVIVFIMTGPFIVVGFIFTSAMCGGMSSVARPDYLGADSVDVPALFAPHFGGDIQAKTLMIEDGFVSVTARVPTGFDRQYYQAGTLYDPEPAKVDDPEEARTVRLADVDFAKVPAMVAWAVENRTVKGDIEELSLFLQAVQGGRWYLDLEAERGDESFYFDLAGNPREKN